MVKIVIPIERFQNQASRIFPHFGRAPLFALVTLTNDQEIEDINPVQNKGEHFGGHGAAEVLALNLNADAIIVKGMGPRGLQAFQKKGVGVFTGDVNTVGEAIDAYVKERLSALTEPCREAQYK